MYPVRARAHIHDAVAFHQHRGPHRHAAPDDACVALCGLIAALELLVEVIPPEALVGGLGVWGKEADSSVEALAEPFRISVA